MSDLRWYVMHSHGDRETHEHSVCFGDHQGDWPNYNHEGVETETWEENRARYWAEVRTEGGR